MATISRYETKSGATLYRVRYRKPDGKQTCNKARPGGRRVKR